MYAAKDRLVTTSSISRSDEESDSVVLDVDRIVWVAAIFLVEVLVGLVGVIEVGIGVLKVLVVGLVDVG